MGVFNERTLKKGEMRFGTLTFTPRHPHHSTHSLASCCTGLARISPHPIPQEGAAKAPAWDSSNKTAIPDAWIYLALAALPFRILAWAWMGQLPYF